jgi:hypothetical protein
LSEYLYNITLKECGEFWTLKVIGFRGDERKWRRVEQKSAVDGGEGRIFGGGPNFDCDFSILCRSSFSEAQAITPHVVDKHDSFRPINWHLIIIREYGVDHPGSKFSILGDSLNCLSLESGRQL